jgi:hypothetical protein
VVGFIDHGTLNLLDYKLGVPFNQELMNAKRLGSENPEDEGLILHHVVGGPEAESNCDRTTSGRGSSPGST